MLFALLSSLWLASFGCRENVPPDQTGNILLITVDTLRADHVGAYGYARNTTPRLDRFFTRGQIYLNSYATASFTPPSVISMLTGVYPQHHGVRRFLELHDGSVPLVCELLPETFESAAFVSNAVLTDEAIGIGGCFDEYDDYVDELEGPIRKIYERRASRTTDAALAWLENREDASRRLFLWVHYIDPHGPYRPPDEARFDFDHRGHVPFDTWKTPPYANVGVGDLLEMIDLYDGEIAYADREVGRLLAGWKKVSDVTRDLVIFTADHGESLGEHDVFFDHGTHVWEEQIRIPLMVRAPGLKPRRVDALASLVDVAPTILAFAGVARPANLQGLDLLDLEREAERMIYAESWPWATVVKRSGNDGSKKWMAQFLGDGRRLVERRAYDLSRDSGERKEMEYETTEAAFEWLLEMGRLAQPGSTIESERQGVLRHAPKVAPGATEEQLERLRGLGYVE